MRQPNIVFLLADDLGWSDLGCYGSTFYETPALDQLAREGTKFNSFYATGPVCSPTRASIMTGKYPPRTGITDWLRAGKSRSSTTRNALALEELTIAEALKEAGYQTFYAGKWHLGFGGFGPTRQGFDEYVEPSEVTRNEPRSRKRKRKGRLSSTQRYTDAALDFIANRDREKPFFLFVSYNDVHKPIQPLPGLVERYEMKAASIKGETPQRSGSEGQTRLRQDDPAYASMLAAVDQSVAQIRKKLAELELDGDTIIVFTSDNGGLSTGSRIGPTCNLPWRAGKGWLYEGGIRVPLLVYTPGRGEPGQICDVPLNSCDFYPTLLDLASLASRPEQHLDGVSFAGFLLGASAPASRTLFWHYPHGEKDYRTPSAAIRDGDMKLIKFYDGDRTELYNLKDDSGEEHNLADSDPERRDFLLTKLREWQKSVGAHLP